MPRGDKSKYKGKPERKADHIAESYESRGVPEKEAEREGGRQATRKAAADPRPTGIPCLIAKRRRAGRPSIGQTASGGAFSRGKKGRGHAQASCFAVNTGHHDRVHSPNCSAHMELWYRFA